MASIRAYGDKGWRVHVSASRKGFATLVDTKTFDSKRVAQQWAAERQSQLRSEIAAQALGNLGLGKTLKEAFDRYLEEVSQTKRGYAWEVKRLNMFAKHLPVGLPLCAISEGHIERFREQRKEAVTAGTILRDFNLLSHVFEVARRDWKWIKENPCANVRRPKSPKHRSRIISNSEIKAMCRQLGYVSGYAPNSMKQVVALCFLLALRTGMRSGEILGLTWDRVFEYHVHLNQTKTDTPRDVPLDHRAKVLLKLLINQDAIPTLGISAASRDSLFRKARNMAGLSGFTFHDARHNAATRIGKQVGKPGKLSIFEFCTIFGWQSTKFAMVYVNPSAAEIAAKL